LPSEGMVCESRGSPMNTRALSSFRSLLLVVGCFAGVACGGSKPAGSNTAAATTTSTGTATTKPPPPAPKCESLDEKCASKKATKAKIGGSDFQLTPPEGWVYAQLADGLLAQVDATGGAMVVRQVTVSDPKKELAERDKHIEELAKLLDVTMGKAKVKWKDKPFDSKDVAKSKADLWLVMSVSRAKTSGLVLAMWSPRGDGKALVGLVFKPNEDANKTDEVAVAALQSLTGGK
jgi:hypothetical protein